MLLTLILSGLAGAFYPKVRPQVADILARVLPQDDVLEPAVIEIATFGLALLAVSILLVLTGTSGNAVLVLAGGLIGAFHKPIKTLIMNQKG